MIFICDECHMIFDNPDKALEHKLNTGHEVRRVKDDTK